MSSGALGACGTNSLELRYLEGANEQTGGVIATGGLSSGGTAIGGSSSGGEASGGWSTGGATTGGYGTGGYPGTGGCATSDCAPDPCDRTFDCEVPLTICLGWYEKCQNCETSLDCALGEACDPILLRCAPRCDPEASPMCGPYAYCAKHREVCLECGAYGLECERGDICVTGKCAPCDQVPGCRPPESTGTP